MKNKRKLSLAVIFALVLSLLLVPLTQAKADAAGGAANLVLKNGNIHTFDRYRHVAQAVAVKDGKIVFVGNDKDVKRWIGKGTKVVDLKGKLVLPSFFDSHAHASQTVKSLYAVSLQGLPSLDKYLEAIREFAKAHPEATVIQGNGWSNTLFPPTGPTKQSLDAISTEIPIILYSEDEHSVWVNSQALKMAGITKETPDPAGGRIERDAAGEPSGTLRESATDLVNNILPDFTVEEYEAGILKYQEMALAFGQTAVWDPTPSRNAIEAYKALAKKGQLKMRVRAGYRVEPAAGVEQINGFVMARAQDDVGDLFKVDSVKMFADGVIEGTTGYLLQPYEAAANKPAGYRGEPLLQPEQFNQIVAAANKAGFKVHVHAIGDAACRETLDAFQYSADQNGDKDYRNAITHLQLVDPQDIIRFKKLGVVAVPQPYWAMKDDYYYNLQLPFLGQDRADAEYPIESFFKAGVQVASASDYPVTYWANPLEAIQIGVTRITTDRLIADYGLDATDTKFKEPLWPAERASLDEMIASFTCKGAYANFLYDETGEIEVGKSADMVILDKDLYKIPSDKIDTAKVLITFFKGLPVYQDKSFAF